MKTKLDTLLETTNIMMKTFKTLSDKVDKKFDNLNDRIIAVVNQNKCFDESNRKAMNRNWSNQKANSSLKNKTGNK